MDSETEEPDTWEVKAVVDKRINDVTGGVEYLIEWKNWDGPPTWEPIENCDCTLLIRRFEKEAAKKGIAFYDEIKERRLVLEEIIGAVKAGTDIQLLVKWEGLIEPEKVPLQTLRRFHCQDILDFFLNKIKWSENS